MKLRRPLFLLPVLFAVAFGQDQGQTDRVDLVSGRLGHAEAKAFGLVLHADEATLNRDTGELVMRGHVHATLPARDDHTVIRYGTGVLVTDQSIGLTADHLTLKNGLLQASGSIVVVPVDPELPKVQLRGDDIYMYLKIGDATLRGNVRPIGIPAQVEFRRAPINQRVFPPDIIK